MTKLNNMTFLQAIDSELQNRDEYRFPKNIRKEIIADLSAQAFDIVWNAAYDEVGRDLKYDLDLELSGPIGGRIIRNVAYHFIGDIYDMAYDEGNRQLIMKRKHRSHPKKNYVHEPNCCEVTTRVENYIGHEYPDIPEEEYLETVAHLSNEAFPIVWDACHDCSTHILTYRLDNKVGKGITGNTIKGVVRQFVGDMYNVDFDEENSQLQLVRHH